MRLQQRGAEGRREDQGRQHRQAHGRDDGHRELPVDHALRAAEERHRNEDGGQHQGDADQGAGDLLHRLAGGLDRAEAFFAHHPLDVLDHDDGVVDQEADGQDQGEHGQDVDRVADRRQDPERAQQNHGHGDGGDQGGPPVLQEQEDHQEDQDDGLDQGLHHLLDGLPDEGGGVDGGGVADRRREGLGQLRQPRLDGVGGVQGVGSRRQADRHARCAPAVEPHHGAVVLSAQLHPGHVAQMHDGAARRVLEDDVLELLGRTQPGLGGDGGVQRGARQGGSGAHLAGGDLGVLRADGRDHVRGRQRIAGQLVGIDPDPHGVLRPEQLGVSHAGDPGNRILDIGGDEVADVEVGILGIEAQHHQEVSGRLHHRQPLLLHFLGQEGRGALQLVLDLHLGDIDVGLGVEGQGDRRRAIAAAGRRHIEQPVDPLHPLFDDLGDAVFDRLGRGARIDRLHRHLRQGDRRILRNGQGCDGQGAGQHHHDRQHPGEDRPVDEEAGQHG